MLRQNIVMLRQNIVMLRQNIAMLRQNIPIDISRKQCRDVALLRLIKGFGQRIIKFGRCLMLRQNIPLHSKTRSVRFPTSLQNQKRIAYLFQNACKITMKLQRNH